MAYLTGYLCLSIASLLFFCQEATHFTIDAETGEKIPNAGVSHPPQLETQSSLAKDLDELSSMINIDELDIFSYLQEAEPQETPAHTPPYSLTDQSQSSSPADQGELLEKHNLIASLATSLLLLMISSWGLLFFGVDFLPRIFFAKILFFKY